MKQVKLVLYIQAKRASSKLFDREREYRTVLHHEFNPLNTKAPHSSRGLLCTNAQSNLVQFFRCCNVKVKLKMTK
jgi:hypothetical protein